MNVMYVCCYSIVLLSTMCVALIMACLYITKAHGNYRDEKERGSIFLQLLYPCFWTCAYVCLCYNVSSPL